MNKITRIDEYKFNKENLAINNFNEKVNMLMEDNLKLIARSVFEADDKKREVRKFAAQILAQFFINYDTRHEDLINTIAIDGIEEFMQHIVKVMSQNESIEKLLSYDKENVAQEGYEDFEKLLSDHEEEVYNHDGLRMLIYDFIHQNELGEKFYKFLKSNKDREGYPTDIDHLMLDYQPIK